MNGKGYGRNWLWSILKYSIPATALRDWNKSQQNLSYNSRCPNSDLNSKFPKRKSEVLTHDPTSSAGNTVVNALLCYEKQYHSEISQNATFKRHSKSDTASDSE